MAEKRRPVVAGNWKMNKNPNEGNSFINDVLGNLLEVKNVDIVFCPPFTGLNNVSSVSFLKSRAVSNLIGVNLSPICINKSVI